MYGGRSPGSESESYRCLGVGTILRPDTKGQVAGIGEGDGAPWIRPNQDANVDRSPGGSPPKSMTLHACPR